MVAEIIDGELIVPPRPASPHARATSVLGVDLGGPFDRPPGDPAGAGGWWLLFEPELHLGPDVIVPDYAGWRRDRLPVLPNVAAFELAPDWVCEVVSPSTGAVRSRKMASTPASGWGTSGSSTRSCAPSRSTDWRTRAGSWRARTAVPTPSAPSPSMRSSSG